MPLYYEMKRSELSDDVFGIPQERKYPMPDKKHTISAIKLFNHVDEKYEEQLAKKIIINMKKYDIDPSMIGEKNRLRKYLPKDMLNEFVSSEVIKDYKSKEDMRLNQFTKMALTDSFIQVYKEQYKTLSHVRINKDTKGFVWLDKQQLVAIINTEIKDDDYVWVNAFEIFGTYKGHGLSKQILRVAIKELKITHLSVNKDNKVAYELYKKYGFKTYKETDKMYFMRINNIENESFVQEEALIDKDNLPKYIYHISYINHDGETFEPRVYENDNVKNKMERRVKRVCFSDSITRALYSIFPNGAYDADFYVHIPGSECKVYKTSTDDIYDSDITHELWIKEPVKMKCIGKIHVSGVSNKTHTIEVDKDKAGYGKKKYHETRWNWTEKYEENNTLFESHIISSKEDNNMIYENLILNKKDLEINLDKFISGEKNVLLVTGFSGSGKSTLASQSATKYRCVHYELDCLDFYLGGHLTAENMVGNEDGLYEFVKRKRLKFNDKSQSGNDLYREYIKFLINWCKQQKDKKFIIEGLQIYEIFEEGDTFITSCPMIIKGTSGLVSAIRAAKRNDGSFLKEFGPLLKWALKDERKLNQLKKSINEFYVSESRNESEYTYTTLKNSKEVNEFYKCFKKSFGIESDMEEKKVLKYMKAIQFNGKTIGYIGFSYYNYKHKKYLGIGNFMISPEYQSSGHGAKVIHDIIEKNKSTYDEIYCYVDKDNVKAIKFYQRIADVDTENLTKYGYYVCLYSKSLINEFCIKESSTNKSLYHLSQSNLDGKTLQPRIPSNFFTKNGYEDGKTKRVCFAKSIDCCLRAMSQKCTGMKLYVHIPDGNYNTYNPTTKQVPDCKITSEVWIKEPVKLKCIGQIEVIKDKGEDGIPYKYGNNTAELYDWEWKWIKKYDSLNESFNTKDYKREKILITTEELLKNFGKNPKISKSDKEKWINHKKQMFGDSLCISALGNDGLTKLCANVNKEIKPLGGYLSPDNYGTAFLSVKESNVVTEEAEYDTKNKYPVYIVAMHSGTPLSNIIKKVTKDEFSHACISFNSELDPLYSFGSKKFGESELGLVIQNSHVEFYKNYKAHYKVFVAFVDQESYMKMKERLKWFEENEDKLKYDILGLVQILFKKDTEKKTYKYFCSRFVSEILSYGKPLNKVASLYKPQELTELDFVSLVNGGDDFYKYDSKITKRNLKNIKNHIFNNTILGESEFSKYNYEVWKAYHLEEKYKDPKYCCWDEEQYYCDMESAVRALYSSNKEFGDYYVYTDLGCGKTKFIGEISYYLNNNNEPCYTWTKTINEVSYLTEDNAANSAIVGTAGNVFIHQCMKKNTFVDTPEKEYIVSRDGGTDIFRFDKEGNKYKLTRDELISDYEIEKTYKFVKPLNDSLEYYKNLLKSNSGYEFYCNLINHKGPMSDLSLDVRFESVSSFFEEIEKIKNTIFCEYYNIKSNKSIIDWINKNIQSLTETLHRKDFGESIVESSTKSDYVDIMIYQLKTLRECIQSIS